MRYLKIHPILESLNDIKELNVVKDIFDFLEDDFGFSVEYKLILFEDNMKSTYDLDGNLKNSMFKSNISVKNFFGETISPRSLKRWIVDFSGNSDKDTIIKSIELVKSKSKMVENLTGLKFNKNASTFRQNTYLYSLDNLDPDVRGGKFGIYIAFELGTNNENSSASGSTAGSGDISNPRVGGSEGSGDLPFHLKRSKKRKKGTSSQVSDLRDLRIEKTKKIKH
jgi:hypothetical protein